MSTIRERAADDDLAPWPWRTEEAARAALYAAILDRRALLAALDALVEAVNVAGIPTLLVFAEGNEGVRLTIDALRAALAKAKEATDG